MGLLHPWLEKKRWAHQGLSELGLEMGTCKRCTAQSIGEEAVRLWSALQVQEGSKSLTGLFGDVQRLELSER